MKKPTIEELRDEFYEDVEPQKYKTIVDQVVDTWRWGTVKQIVMQRIEDNTYWSLCYRLSSDGETNELSDLDISDDDIIQVEPKETVKIEYLPIVKG